MMRALSGWRDWWVFALPVGVGLVVWMALPAAASLLLACTRWDGVSFSHGLDWVGAEHFRALVSDGQQGMRNPDSRVRVATLNSLVYTVMAVPVSLVVSLLLALLLNVRARGAGVCRTVFILPSMLGGVAVILIWSWLFNPRFGPVNEALRGVYAALDPLVRWFDPAGTTQWAIPDWFYSPSACKPALALMHVWLSGTSMLVFLAALQRVPPELLEAAALDGAGRVRAFWHVTWPHITPAVLFNLVMGVIYSMQAFDQAYLLYNRAQGDGLLFFMLHLYRTAFEPPQAIGHACALAWVLFAFIALLVAPLLLISRWWVFYRVRA